MAVSREARERAAHGQRLRQAWLLEWRRQVRAVPVAEVRAVPAAARPVGAAAGVGNRLIGLHRCAKEIQRLLEVVRGVLAAEFVRVPRLGNERDVCARTAECLIEARDICKTGVLVSNSEKQGRCDLACGVEG